MDAANQESTDLPLMDQLVLRMLDAHAESHPSPLAEAALLRESRLSGVTLRRVAARIPRSIVAETLEIRPDQLPKLFAGRLGRTQTEQVLHLVGLWARLETLFQGDQAMLEGWIAEPIAALGVAPAELLATFSGRDVIEDLTRRIQYGDLSL